MTAGLRCYISLRHRSESVEAPGGYNYPNRILLNHYGGFESKSIPPSDDPDATVVIRVLENNGTSAWVEEIKQGPTFRQYKIGFKRGTLRSSGLKHNDDFAQNLCVSSVRIIPPGQDNPFITIEVPNKKRFTIGFDKMVDSLKASKANIPMALGMDVNGELSVIDVAQMHHVLILGDTGSGKTVFINSFLNSILFSRTPDQVRILLADLGDYGLSVYTGIPHLISSVMTKPEDVLKAMEDLCSEMERRMVLFRESSTNSIKVFNDVAGKNNEWEMHFFRRLILLILLKNSERKIMVRLPSTMLRIAMNLLSPRKFLPEFNRKKQEERL